jgi:hypothetical protein
MKAMPMRRLICVSEIFRSRVMGCTRRGREALSIKATALTRHITIANPHDALFLSIRGGLSPGD